MNEKGILGRSGEEAAAKYLKEAGYAIVARNFRCLPGEIDIIAYIREAKLMCFVEVKTRRSKCYGRPAEAVNAEKRRHIMRAAECFMTLKGLYGRLDMRFDVIEAFTDEPDAEGSRRFEISHIEGAFREGW